MPVARRESSSDSSRVIAHVDMDCFYVQVEQRKQPSLRGHPTAVVQYNSWKGGGLIAVGYEARTYGVKRSMRGDEAKKVCPQIELVQVPVARGKADLSVYRNAGSEVVSILSRKGRCERASIDEVYLDLTEAAETMLAENPPDRLESIIEESLRSNVLGLHLDGANDRDCAREWFLNSDADRRDKLLACGACIVAELRMEVLKETEFTCSAGIAHNKMLAKLASGMNKPAQQTVVPSSSVKNLLEPLPIKKMKQLGGKLGTSLQDDLGVNTVGDLLQFSEEKLQERYGINTGLLSALCFMMLSSSTYKSIVIGGKLTWLWNIARGICGDEVEGRLLPKSHGSGKTFPGPQALKTLASVQKWLYDLCEELNERLLCDLEKNKRIAHTLSLHASAYKLNDSESFKKFPSKSCPLRYGIAKIQEDALNLFNAGLRDYVGTYHVRTKESKHEWAITGLSVSASKIVAIPSGTHSIMKYFHYQNQPCTTSNELNDICTQNDAASLSSSGNGNDIQLHLADTQIDSYDDGTRIQCDILCLDPDGDETEMCEDDACIITKVADNQDPVFFTMEQQKDRLTEEILYSSSGAENGSGSKLTQSKMDFLGPSLQSEKQKRKLEKEKGTTSILRFFNSQGSCSFPEQYSHVQIQESGTSSSGKLLLVQENQNGWSYKSDEIDPTVLSELPPEIQEEVRASLQPQKRVMKKKGSSIVHYFTPTSSNS